MSEPALPEVPGAGTGALAPCARAGPARRAVCARRLHAPAYARAAGLSEWDASVHVALSGERRDAPRGRGDPAPPRRRDWRAEPPPHVGANLGPPSPRALRVPGWWGCSRSPALDSLHVPGLRPSRA